jgi:Pyruvate/2-oxoacid:ferredoxin oxidoreductase delta subunit
MDNELENRKYHKENKIRYPVFDINMCIGCGTCVDNCPQDALSLVNDKVHIDYHKCDGCMICVDVCPQKGIH